MLDFINFMEKVDKTSKLVVNSVSTSVLAKNDYEQTLDIVKGLLLGLLIDIGKEGAKEEK